MFFPEYGILDQHEYVCFNRKGTELLNKLDSRFLSFVQGRDLQSFTIPALIHGHVLSRCGYFESFPDQIMAVGTLDKKDWDQIMDGAELPLSISCRNRNFSPPPPAYTYTPCCRISSLKRT